MSASQNVRRFDEVLGARKNIARVTDIFGRRPSVALALPGQSPMADFVRGINDSRPAYVPDGIGTVAGAAAGLYVFRNTHPLLGVIGGGSLGRNLPALFQPQYRTLALQNLTQTGLGVVGSLWFGKSATSRALGFAAGWIAGGVLVYMQDRGR